MNRNKGLSEEESLKRSHSVKSIANLSLISIISTIILAMLCVSIGLIKELDYAKYIAIASGALFILCLLLFSKFKR